MQGCATCDKMFWGLCMNVLPHHAREYMLHKPWNVLFNGLFMQPLYRLLYTGFSIGYLIGQ